MSGGGSEGRLRSVAGLLLDIDGVLSVSWEPIPGAVDAVRGLRARGIPFRLVTNTTELGRRRLAQTLREAGFDVGEKDLVTATFATASYLQAHHPGARCFLVAEGDAAEDLAGVELVEDRADVVVVGGAGPVFSWERINRAFRFLVDGAALVGMHRNLSWMTADGLCLDAGAYLAGLELAAGVQAEVAGKPAPAFFRQALDILGVPAGQAAMVGDDVENDVLAAQAVGLTGVLVRTGKFRQEAIDRAAGTPDVVIDSIADLSALIG
jgi:HAD superfamily hydrolase (TIGR01458 family)